MSSTQTKPMSNAAVEKAAAEWMGRRDAGLSEAEEAEFARWRAEDPRHEAAIRRQEQSWNFFDRPSGAQADALVEALAQSRTRRRHRRMVGAAGAMAVALAFGLLWYRGGTQPGPIDPAATMGVVVLPDRRTLPDGSTVELKPGAEITVDYSGVFRMVGLVKGEALFQVVKNTERPFVVHAAGVEFRAVGTAFSVEYGIGSVALLVTEGRVAVSEVGAESVAGEAGAAIMPTGTVVEAVPREESSVLTVDAGQRMVVDLVGGKPALEKPIALAPSEMAERLGWRAARLEFTDTPLEAAVVLFNRHSEGRLPMVVDPGQPELRRLQVSGYFRAQNAEAFLVLLDQSLGVKARHTPQEIILFRDPR